MAMRAWALAAALVFVSGAAMAADCSAPAPIVFEPGAASVMIASPPSSGDCFQYTARGNERVTITLDNAADDAVFAIYAPGWTAKCDGEGACELTGDLLSEDDTKAWADTLSPGAYLIVVDNSKSGLDYELTVDMQ